MTSSGRTAASGRTARGRDRSKTVAAASGDEGDAAREEASADGEQQREEEEEEEFTVAGTVRRKREAAAAEAKKNAGGGFSLDEINPVEIGRRSRNAIDGFFKQITSLTTFQRQASYDEAKFDAVYDADLLSGASVMTVRLSHVMRATMRRGLARWVPRTALTRRSRASPIFRCVTVIRRPRGSMQRVDRERRRRRVVADHLAEKARVSAPRKDFRRVARRALLLDH